MPLVAIGSIMLWDTSTPPNGWEVYTAAQGRFVMGYISNGINIYDNPKQGNLNWKTVLEGGGGSGGDGTHNVMSTTQLGEARTGKYLIMNKFAESETKSSRLDVDFNSLYTDIKNKLVGEGFESHVS